MAQPRAFEWNILHHSGLVNACLVIDGLLYRDDDSSRHEALAAAYAKATVFRLDVPPLLVPAVEVGWLITAHPSDTVRRRRPGLPSTESATALS